MPGYVVVDEEEIYYPICGIYNKTPEKTLAPGLYLGLMHGRRPADERLGGWGLDGPIIGPLKYVHTTYGQDLHLAAVDGTELESLQVEGGLIEFNGIHYGDWTVFIIDRGRTRRAAKAARPRSADRSGPRHGGARRGTLASRSRLILPPVGKKLLTADVRAGVTEEHLEDVEGGDV